MSDIAGWYGLHKDRTDWGHCKAGVADMLDAFVEYSLLDPPRSSQAKASWRRGMRNFIEEYGEDKDLLRKTIQFMKNRGWYVVDPHSIFKSARILKSDSNDADSEQSRRRYLEGIE